MRSPFLALNREVAAFEMALLQASDELNRPRSTRRHRRSSWRRADRRQ
jgi:hypothetical protein